MIMRTFIFIVLFGLLTNLSFTQSLPDFEAIKLEQKEDFNPISDNAALQASNFLLSTPFDKNNIDRIKALRFTLRWMSGTPDYKFTFDKQATKFAKRNHHLLGLYIAAMTKFVLENETDSKDQDKIKLNALKLVLEYVKDEKNKVRINSELKKAIEADNKGKLSEYLKL